MLARITAKLEAISRAHYPDLRAPADIAKVSAESLLFYFGNIHSQRGQDGILAEIFRRLGMASGRFVEFGAWDGVYLSNCRFLFEKGWSGVFIEADRARFSDLERRYAGTRATCLKAMVGTEPGNRLGDLVRSDGVTFVSIDVDGADLEIFATMAFSPPVVLIEGGFNFSPYLTEAIPNDVAARNLQQPLAVICEAARSLGYVPVCFYQDTYLVRHDLAEPFKSLSPVELYSDAFYFMPGKYRMKLLEMRRRSEVIRSYELAAFGVFHEDPLAYERHDCLTSPSC